MNCKLRHLAEMKIRTDLFQADQTGRKDENTCRHPRCLIAETDCRITVDRNKDQADHDPCHHLCHAGKYCSAGITKSLCRHAAHIQDTETPEEKALTEQIHCGSIQHFIFPAADKNPAQIPSEEDQQNSGTQTITHSNCHSLKKSLDDTFLFACTQILAAKNGHARGDRIKRTHEKLFQPQCRRKCRDIHNAVETVIGILHHHASDRRDRILQSHRYAHGAHDPHSTALHMTILSGNPKHRHLCPDVNAAQNAADRLRRDRCSRHAGTTPVKYQNADKIQ